ncbi:DUF4244 domain-containing protein [Cellulomonas sp. PhB143]|uniref:DUF4244 domain-containing protein n=1 Tax=Cellulomonas sp. PhB143 TaxID=2485186 RepID=UPI000F4929EC|nr:DUF4244 domain-containing protein [Cellulomonas sp. PhB143]ROS76577.1 uncharacterized protein DUF4244 [Cellulomonas sp. PhB143]
MTRTTHDTHPVQGPEDVSGEATTSRWQQVRATGDAGLATAEYAVATVAAVGFAGLLIAILKSDEVRELLLGIIRGALSVG